MDKYSKLNQEAFDRIAEKYGGYRRRAHEIIRNFIAESKTKILDLGCGNLSYMLEYPTKIFGIDFSIESLQKVDRENVELINADITNLPIKSNSFQRAMCIFALHNLSPELQQKAMSELNRILEEQGIALITVWAKFQQRFMSLQSMINFRNNKPVEVKWGELKRYYFLFTQKQLRKLCEDAGFNIIELNEFQSNENKNFYAIIQKIRTPNFNKKEKIYYPKTAYLKMKEFSIEAKKKYDQVVDKPLISPK